MSIENGEVFGRWTVIRRASPARRSTEAHVRARVIVRCVCKRERYAFEVDLRAGRTTGCASGECQARWRAVQALRAEIEASFAAYLGGAQSAPVAAETEDG